MIKWWYKLFVNFCSAILLNSTSFQVPVFKMSTFTLTIVALFTTALMQLAITKCTDFRFFMLQHNEERGLSFQTDFFFDSLKAEYCESQNCGRHYTNIMCMFVVIPSKTYRRERSNAASLHCDFFGWHIQKLWAKKEEQKKLMWGITNTIDFYMKGMASFPLCLLW